MAYDQVKQYNEDDAHTSGDKGMQILAVRDDTLNARSGTENDYEPLHTNADGALWSIDVNSAAIKTAVETIDNAIAGSEMQVDVLTMPTVTINSPAVTNAGTFVVQENGAALTSLQLLDDTVQVLGTDTYTEATSKGITLGAVRRDADTTLVNTTNEFGPLQMDARGFVKTEVFSGETLPVSLTSTTVTGTVAVTQSGTWDEVGINDSGNSITVDAIDLDIRNLVAATDIVDLGGNALTSLQLIDDTVFTAGTSTFTEATSKGALSLAVRRDANTSLVDTTNEMAPLQVNATGELKTAIIQALPAGTNNIGDVDIVSGTITTVSTVTSLTQMNGAAISMNTGVRDAGTQRVTIATNDAVPVTFTGSTDVATQTTLASALTALQIMDDWDNGASDGASVSGDVAHDTGDAGEPVKIGMKAYELDGTAPQTAVAEADRVNAIGDLVGRQFVATEHPRFFHVSVDYASAQTNATIKAATGASTAIYITDIMISNGATAGNITLLDGSGGTVLFEIYPAINGGVSLNLKNPIKLTDNTLLAITSTTVTTHSVFVSGFVD